MDQSTHDVRAAHWKNIIQNCHQRPADQSTKRWLKENDILEQSYYYWQRKFRKEAYDQLPKSSLPSIQSISSEISFAEIAMPEQKTRDCSSDEMTPVVIKTATMQLEISNNISEHLLLKILQEVAHA